MVNFAHFFRWSCSISVPKNKQDGHYRVHVSSFVDIHLGNQSYLPFVASLISIRPPLSSLATHDRLSPDDGLDTRCSFVLVLVIFIIQMTYSMSNKGY